MATSRVPKNTDVPILKLRDLTDSRFDSITDSVRHGWKDKLLHLYATITCAHMHTRSRNFGVHRYSVPFAPCFWGSGPLLRDRRPCYLSVLAFSDYVKRSVNFVDGHWSATAGQRRPFQGRPGTQLHCSPGLLCWIDRPPFWYPGCHTTPGGRGWGRGRRQLLLLLLGPHPKSPPVRLRGAARAVRNSTDNHGYSVFPPRIGSGKHN